MIHIWRPWKLSNFQDPHPYPSTSEIPLHPRSWTSNFKQTPPLQMITNELKKNMIQGWLFGYYMLSTKFIINKRWLHCLTSESKRKFLVSNILFGLAWSLVMAQIQFSLIKKDWTLRTLAAPPTPLRPTRAHFYLTPTSPPSTHTPHLPPYPASTWMSYVHSP